ncbi:hypothetical protein KSS87_009359 [Heliosperma pusillum]|nr:hypothetical protein KSS87_009359 [Heliosperma pusillum]
MAAIYAGTSASMAAATTGLLPRVPINQVSPFLALPYLPPRSFAPSLRVSAGHAVKFLFLDFECLDLGTWGILYSGLGSEIEFTEDPELLDRTVALVAFHHKGNRKQMRYNFSAESRRLSSFQRKASSTEETSTSVDSGELFDDLKEKWDKIENKSTVLLYGGGALVAVWLSSVVVGAINSVPLLPKIMELVGLGYTGWFVYRYLLFKSSRKELAEDIESLKKKIAGTE